MKFNQTEIGLLLFYSTGLLLVILLFLIALPTILQGRIEEEAKKLASKKAHK